MTTHAPLIIDIAGQQLIDVDRRRLAHPLVGGVILFTRNWENRAQLQALTQDIKAIRDDLLICVDHEGGRVQRFQGDGLTHLPPMRVLGEIWLDDDQGAPGSGAILANVTAEQVGYVLGSELRACGVDFSFTPVLDLDWGRSEVIGNRALSDSPYIVTQLGHSLVKGLSQAGMGNCAKHFPGHGFVQTDSHTEVPVDRRHLKDILANDTDPYLRMTEVLMAVMPAHIIYPQVDSRPAGFSAKWLKDILRGRLCFQGAIISDDLSMAAARCLDGRAVSYTEAAVAALHAGCDLLLFCNQSLVADGQPIDVLLQGLKNAQLSGQWQPNQTSETRRIALLPSSPPLSWDALRATENYCYAKEFLP